MSNDKFLVVASLELAPVVGNKFNAPNMTLFTN